MEPFDGLTAFLRGHLEAGDGPRHRRLYLAMRAAILDSRLGPGARLPATRALAQALDLGRNTVTAAYDQLLAEGYVTARTGAGTFVTEDLPDTFHDAAPTATARARHRPPPPSRLVRRLGPREEAGAAIDRPFRAAIPDIRAFPWATWSRILGRRWRRPGPLALPSDPFGLPALREAIAAYLRTSRATACHADQVVVTAGAQQALDLAARLVLDSGDRVAVEDPGFPGADATLAAAGARLLPVPVDGDGLDHVALPGGCRAVLVTPSRNYPLGITMTLARRLALLDWARVNDAWIIEDDYDSEFRFDGRPVAALQGLDEDGRVLYAGTFVRAMFPALRLGYLVVPDGLIDAARALRRGMDGGTSTVPQAAMADFLGEGHFASHLRAMRRLYQGRHDALHDFLNRELAGALTPVPADGGMHVTALLAPDLSDQALCTALDQAGVSATALSPYYRHRPQPGLILGFAGWPEDRLRAAGDRLAGVVLARVVTGAIASPVKRA